MVFLWGGGDNLVQYQMIPLQIHTKYCTCVLKGEKLLSGIITAHDYKKLWHLQMTGCTAVGDE